MNSTNRRILQHLAQATAPVYGLDLVKAKVASRYTLYVHMAQLEDAGFVEGVEDAIGQRRRYTITDAGRMTIAKLVR